jgi:putative ABC transport system substrate-binding protein
MAYNPNTTANWKRAAHYVDRILKGTKAGDLPVEQPSRLDFVINLQTAEALGLALPQALLAQASDLIR